MRPPHRAYDQPHILALLAEAWAKHPDLTLGEVVCVMAERAGEMDPWAIGLSGAEKGLRSLIEEPVANARRGCNIVRPIVAR